MDKGRLLASVCALGLIVAAAPTFAADNSSSSTPGAATGAAPGAATGAAPGAATGATPGAAPGAAATGGAPGGTMSNPSGASQPAAAAGSATENNPASASQAGTPQTRPSRRAMHRRRRYGHQAMRQSRRGGDTSQDADVDRLNDQSLQAARRGEPFTGGNSNAPAEGTGGPGTSSAPPSGNTKM